MREINQKKVLLLLKKGVKLNSLCSIVCELTHRCPLSCPYCSNPVNLEKNQMRLEYRILEKSFNRSSKFRNFTGTFFWW